MRLIDALEESDDVAAVHANFDVDAPCSSGSLPERLRYPPRPMLEASADDCVCGRGLARYRSVRELDGVGRAARALRRLRPRRRSRRRRAVPADISTKPVVKVPSSCSNKQLVTKDLIPGTGQAAQAGQTVTVNYVGVLCKTGKEFDSSWKRNQPFTTALTQGSVIPGWVKGIPGMRVGGPPRADHPAEPRLREGGQPADDPA